MQNKTLYILYISAFILGLAILMSYFAVEPTTADTSDVVGVSATVETSVSCSSDPATTTFPTLTTTAVATSTPNATSTLSCNYAAGCTLRVYDQGDGTNPGLASSTVPTIIIGSAKDGTYDDTYALVAGTVEGYGIKGATTSAGTGQDNEILRMQNPRYNQYDLGVGNYTVGGLERSGSQQQIASSTKPISGRELVVTHLASITGLTEASLYEDQTYYTCIGN